jgi:hypothetical protein
MVMIVEEPRVNVALTQGLLDGGEVHIQTVILHDRCSSLKVWSAIVEPTHIVSPSEVDSAMVLL